MREDISQSKHFLTKEKPEFIQIILFVCLFNLVLTAMMMVGMPVLLVDTIGVSDELFGLSQGIFALGGLCGGIATALLSKKLKVQSAHLQLLFCSMCIGAMAIPFFTGMGQNASYIFITAFGFLLMGLATMFSVLMIAKVQMETPAELVGKVLALAMSLAMCAQPVGQAIYGFVFERFGAFPGAILFIVAVISVVIALASKKTFLHLK